MLRGSILQFFRPALSDNQSWKSFLLSSFVWPFMTGLTVLLNFTVTNHVSKQISIFSAYSFHRSSDFSDWLKYELCQNLISETCICSCKLPICVPASVVSTWGFQQDCSEFLKYLLDSLHEQEQSYLGKQGETSAKSSNGKRQSTLIEQNFGGKMNTSVVCSNCKAESLCEENFIDIPLAFPDYQATGQKSLIGGDNKMSTRSTTKPSVPAAQTASETSNCLHLTDLLKHYLKEEKLSDDNKYHCNVCDSLQEADRKINIVKTPEYLIFTLLRFSYDTRLHARSKIFREVKYPKTLLLPVSDEERLSSRRQRTKSLRSDVAVQLEACGQGMDADCCDVYSLCSVVIHSGTSSDCGHYYCYARHSIPKNAKSMCENLQNCSNEDEIDFLGR